MTRNNFFLLLETALLAFVLNQGENLKGIQEPLICMVGFLLAVVWFWVNWAGRRLQRSWRAIVLQFERDLYAESASGEQIEGAFSYAQRVAQEGRSSVVSITLALLVLSASFVAAWGFLLAASLCS